jgi:glucose 1-dehydrogenase
MADRLVNKRAFITGAAGGIGQACVDAFLKEGALVTIADINLSPAEKYRSSPHIHLEHCDVADVDSLAAAIAGSIERWGGIDILINNAAIVGFCDFLDLTPDLFDSVIATNLKSAVFATQIAAKQMIKQGSGGVVINMSSVNGVLNMPNGLAYNLSKAALIQLTKNNAIALADYDIRVCAIGPGTIATETMRAALAKPGSGGGAAMSRTPMRRPGTPEEVASIAVFLASSEASYITGETIFADGGRLGLNYVMPDRRGDDGARDK